jgi:hypothetical protein
MGTVSAKSGYRSLIITQVVNESSTDQHASHLPQNIMFTYPNDFPIRADFMGGPAARSSSALSWGEPTFMIKLWFNPGNVKGEFYLIIQTSLERMEEALPWPHINIALWSSSVSSQCQSFLLWVSHTTPVAPYIPIGSLDHFSYLPLLNLLTIHRPPSLKCQSVTTLHIQNYFPNCLATPYAQTTESSP